MKVILLVMLMLSTGPATAPAGDPVAGSRLREQLAGLADSDPAVRETARHTLLGMSRPELEELRRLVASGAAPLPSQREALYEIVCHAFLATEPYAAAPEEIIPGEPRPRRYSFLGLSNQQLMVENDGSDGGEAVTGVTFERRLIGFPAFRGLQNGDVILSVAELPGVQFNGPAPLQEVRRAFAPGKEIRLVVRRDDRVIEVPLTLAATPMWQEAGEWALTAREQFADEYWAREFAPLVDRRAE